MTDVKPTYQTPAPPGIEQVLTQHKREIFKELNCARPGIIQSFDPGDAKNAPTVTVQIAQKQVTSIDPLGVRTLAEYPLLLKVPVQFPAGGGFTATFPIAKGDECLVVFCDREIDNWFISGPGKAPTTGRVHDLSDGMALIGFRSNTRALAHISATAVQLRSDNFTTAGAGTGECVEIGPGKIQLIADEVVIHGRNKATFDAGGTGFVYQPNVIDTYTTGVPVNAHAPTPPEVPT